MKKVEFGDIVKVITTDKTYKGAYIDSYNKEIIILKQDSGYNLGIIKKGIKSIELIQKNKLKKNQKKE